MILPKQTRDRIAIGVGLLGVVLLIGEVWWLWPLIAFARSVIWP